MTTQETIALAATIRDAAKKFEELYVGQSGFTTQTMRCQTLYLKLCEEDTPGYKLHDVRVAAAALKVTEALGQTDVDQIRVPAVLTLALLNLERVVRRSSGEGLKQALKDVERHPALDSTRIGHVPGMHAEVRLEQAFADTLAKKCDELAAENKRLESENHNLKGEIVHMRVLGAR